MKKIAIIIAELAAPGGAEKVAADLAQECHDRGHDVTVITFDHAPLQTIPIQGRRIRIALPQKQGGIFTQIPLLLRRAWCFRKLFQREQFDHIFSFLEAANVPCAVASRQSILSVHLNPAMLTKKEWLLVRWLYPRAKQVIAVSQHMKTQLQQVAGLRNVTCIYNPVRSKYVHLCAKEPIAPQTPFILAVGRLSEQKRFDRLIAAYANSALVNELPLLILGDGELRATLQTQITHSGLQEKVHLLGYDPNPYRYMQRAKFLVMSSDYEGYPLTLIEALALSCPVISTDCPTGPREIITDQQNGLLVPLDDIAALSKAMERLYFDASLYEALRQRAPSSVADNDIAPVTDAWLSL